MEIFADINGKAKLIFGKTIPIDELYGQLVDVLEIGSGCNLSQVLMKLAKIQLAAAEGFSYFVYVREKKYVDIVYSPSKNKLKSKDRMTVAQFDGDGISHKELDIFVKRAVLTSWVKLRDICMKEIECFVPKAEP